MSDNKQKLINYLISNEDYNAEKSSKLAENLSVHDLMDALETAVEISNALKQTAVGRVLL
jgi:hypothetical protein